MQQAAGRLWAGARAQARTRVAAAHTVSPAACTRHNDEVLDFGEFVFLVTTRLDDWLPEGWGVYCKEIRSMKEAFDTADVDANNRIEKAELEIVDPGLAYTHRNAVHLRTCSVRRIHAVFKHNIAGRIMPV